MSLTIIPTPTPKEKRTIRILILFGLFSFTLYIGWFATHSHAGLTVLYVLFLISLTYKSLRMLHEWYHYYDMRVPERETPKRDYKVDMLTTYCAGEPRDMVINTLQAMRSVKYPHTTYLCDEADDPILKQYCDDNKIVHVTREKKVNAKAGNINNALQNANGELCIILDPDHIPVPDFIDRVLPHFNDESVGYVQCVQPYYNFDKSLVSRGACQQTFHFYGPMMLSMHSYGTAQAIGANCTFRRKALDSIGGHAAGLTEDMNTSIKLHAKGWKSVYIPEYLTKGLVPESLSAFYKQQLKWSRGSFELLFEIFPKLFRHLSWRQRLHYFTIPLFFLSGVINLIDFLIPILALLLSSVPVFIDFNKFLLFYFPVLFVHLCIRLYAQKWLGEPHEKGLHLVAGALRVGTWFIYCIGFIYSIFRVKVPYIPTPKDNKVTNEWNMILPHIAIIILSVASIYIGINKDSNPYNYIMAGFCVVNILTLLACSIFGLQSFILKVKEYITSKLLLSKIYFKSRYTWARSRFVMHRLFGLLLSNVFAIIALLIGSYMAFLGVSKLNEKRYVHEFIESTREYSNKLYNSNRERLVVNYSESGWRTFELTHLNEKSKGLGSGRKNHFEFSKSIMERNGKFTLFVDGKPFYIKGVAYNVSHAWQDGAIPLSRLYLEKDFEKIKRMGANLIRRYNPSPYDDNILQIAAEQELKVMYGFWFEHHINYYQDSAMVEKYKDMVIRYVKKYKDHPSIVAWNLGNDVWGRLDDSFENPSELRLIQRYYLDMVESLVKEIRKLDPVHPVFTSVEHSNLLYRCLSDLSRYAPSLDGVCINSYYRENISQLDRLVHTFYPGKPYIISEFGPKGYWEKDRTSYDQYNFLKERSSVVKADWYSEQWKNYIYPYKGSNLGGVAYCWRDRLEGTLTWYGITDLKNRMKPAYYALQEAWTGKKHENPFNQAIHIIGYELTYKAGKSYPFEIISRYPIDKNYTYEWVLMKDEYLKEYNLDDFEANGKRVIITIPNEPGVYRLYVFQIDSNGNVNTASKALKINFQ